jgi:DNA adenine methylase
MATPQSPLRYPGGKQILARVLSHIARMNGVVGGTYAEPYAGGAGAALDLLFGEYVHRILINDADVCVHAFWTAALAQTERFIKLLHATPLTVEEWERQRLIYQAPKRHSALRLGFATFYLNRCNRSGIIVNGGPIGGKNQRGKWKIDARYNPAELERRIRKIAAYRDRIALSNLDAIDFLDQVKALPTKAKPFVYLDPPYYAKGQRLYLNYYEPEDHRRLAVYVKKASFPWVMSYDNVPEVRKLYGGLRQVEFDLGYSARERRVGSEILILKEGLRFPRAWARWIPSDFITARDAIRVPMPDAA